MKGNDLLLIAIAFVLGLIVGVQTSYRCYKDAGWCPNCKEIRIVNSEPEYCSICGTEVIVGETNEK